MSNHKIFVTSGKAKQKQLTQQNLHSFTVELESIQKYKRGITWHLVLPAVCGNGLLSVSLSLSVLRCGGYVQSSASWFVQLLACSLSLPSYNGTPLPLVQPPQCLWMGLHQGRVLRTTWTAKQPLVKADVQDTTNVTSLPTPEDMTWAKNTHHSICNGLKIHWFYPMAYWLYMSKQSSHQLTDDQKLR